jgi:hypothetical protein
MIIFGPKIEEITGGWRKIHSEERHDLSFSPSRLIVEVISSRGMRWAGQVAHMGGYGT